MAISTNELVARVERAEKAIVELANYLRVALAFEGRHAQAADEIRASRSAGASNEH